MLDCDVETIVTSI